MKAMNYFLKWSMVVLCMCGITACSSGNDDDDEAEENGIPTNLVGLTMELDDDNNAPYAFGVSLTGTSEKMCEIPGMTKGDSSYTYTVTGENTASLSVLGVQDMVASGTYYTYRWTAKLTYSSPREGTFTGTYLTQV